MMEGSKTDNANATDGLLQTELPYCTAGGAHTVTETLLEPRAVEMATCVLGAQSKKETWNNSFNVYSNSDSLLHNYFLSQCENGRSKHKVCIVSSETQIFNVRYLSSGHPVFA
jgi:hypothetical protein